LVQEGFDVLAATRSRSSIEDYPWGDDVEVRIFDVEDDDAVRGAVAGVNAVVYLVHSMEDDDFVRKDREAAKRVARLAADAGVERIVYLSGLVPDGDLSDHLRSRLEVEQVLLDGPVPTTVLRAAMVVGAGSTSFELLRRLSTRVPWLTPVPRWMRRSLQPVAVEDVVAAVAAALAAPTPHRRHFDLGGDEVVTYPELLALFADVAGLRRTQVFVPAPRAVVARGCALISRMDATTVRNLVDSLSHDMVCAGDDVRRELLPGHEFVPLGEAIARSLGAHGGTTQAGDVQAGAATDPA